MKKLKMAMAFLIALLFIMMPLPAADLYIRLYPEEIEDDDFSLYYSTDTSDFSQEQCIDGEVDWERSMVTFRLDHTLERHITGLRLDVPYSENLLEISNITVSSAGIIQKQFNPSTFFAEENILFKNDMGTISLVTSRNHAYLSTSGEDPFLILAPGLVAEILGAYSHLRLTRLGICLFLFLGYRMYRRNLFQ